MDLKNCKLKASFCHQCRGAAALPGRVSAALVVMLLCHGLLFDYSVKLILMDLIHQSRQIRSIFPILLSVCLMFLYAQP